MRNCRLLRTFKNVQLTDPPISLNARRLMTHEKAISDKHLHPWIIRRCVERKAAEAAAALSGRKEFLLKKQRAIWTCQRNEALIAFPFWIQISSSRCAIEKDQTRQYREQLKRHVMKERKASLVFDKRKVCSSRLDWVFCRALWGAKLEPRRFYVNSRSHFTELYLRNIFNVNGEEFFPKTLAVCPS
jgi:hypothetical protein